MRYRFESISFSDGKLHMNGFALGKDPEAVLSYAVMDKNRKPVTADIRILPRTDVSTRFLNRIVDNNYGFSADFDYKKGGKYYFLIKAGNEKKCLLINDTTAAYYNGLMKLRNNPRLRNLIARIRSARNDEITYDKWFRLSCPSKEELDAQRNRAIKEDDPYFSVVIPLFRTPEVFLRELIESILKQTYAKFEVCFADGSEDDALRKIVESYKDERLRYAFIGENKGISGNTNEAIAMARGNFIILCDHDDLLTENAFYEMAMGIIENPECDCIYSDEDKIDMEGKTVYEPHFKPDFNFDMLRCDNYICHLFAVRKSLVDKYGNLISEYDGAQDFDFILRMCEHARKVIHVPKILYHWRSSPASTAANPESKMYAYKAGAKAVKAHYERALPDVKISAVTDGENYGLYHVHFYFDQKPLISVIIPNKDHRDDLDRAVRSLLTKSTWRNFEVIIMENNSEDPGTFDYYKKLQKEFPNVKVIRYEDEFNYSCINNVGVSHVQGEYILLMNNDVELKEPESIEEMMGYAQRDDVGAVGCRLLYEDQSIQHAGVIVGIGVADHAFKGTFSGDGTYFNRAMTTQDYSAVTAAVMLTKKSVYESVGGMDENLAVAFNDIDYCLKLNQAGKLVVYNPYACFFHYESKTRGADSTSAKNARYMQELTLFTERWQDYYKNGDPYYNPNLTTEKTNFSLKRIDRAK